METIFIEEQDRLINPLGVNQIKMAHDWLLC
jgi:hypothetical protein